MTYENLSKSELLHELEKLSIIDDCYQSSVESAPLGIIAYNELGQTRVFNAQLVEITGYTKDEIPDIQTWQDLINRGVKNQQHWEGTITRKDGEKRSCLFSAILPSSGFETIYITDISEQKQTAVTLKESEERYRSLFNILPYGGEILDTTGRIINCSSSTLQMLGYTEPELIGKHISEFIDPASLQIFHQKMPILLSGKFASAEICMIHKDGTLLNIKRAANPIINADGKVEAILAINVDITNVKKTEEALRIERDNHISIFEAMEDGVFICSQQFEIQYMNLALITELGPYEGKKCYEFFNDRKSPCPWCLNSKVFAGETVRWEWTSPKNHKTYDLIDTPINNLDGSISKLEIIRDISLHKQATKKLKESEERYRSIFQNNQSVMLLIDPETARIVDANPAAVSFYGWSHKELTGKKISDINLLSTEDVFKEIERARKNEEVCFQFSHRLASGEVRDVEVYSNSIIVDEELLLFSVIHDVTDRKIAEKKLAESESQLRSTLQSMSDLVFVMDLEGQFISCNAPSENLYLDPLDFIGKNHSEVMPSHACVGFGQAMEAVLKRETASFEYPLEFDHGKRWFSSKLSPLLQDDELIGAVAVVRDITERKQAEKILREKQKVNDSLINSMPYPIMLIDRSRVVLAANKMAVDIGAKIDDYCWKEFGNCDYLSEENKILAQQKPDDPRIQCTYCRVEQMFETGEIQVDIEVEAFGKLWEVYWIPISDKEFLHYTVDVSERKQAENVLLKTSRMEATATLAAGVAHDFNNLMVGVLGYSELLKNRYETESPASEMLDTIGDCARQAGDLAQQLLAYARGGKYLPKIMNLNNTIQDTLRLNERSFPPRIRIERDYEPELMNVFADAVQMSQVVTNLCINSVEAIESNGRIIITTRNVTLDERFTSFHPSLQPGQYVYLSVEDTGNGMNTETLGKIFEPFFSTKFQGRGLGLAAVYGIVKNHEGYISAYSEVGLGATLKLYFPVAVGQAIPEPRPKPMDICGNETILVIDDEKMVLDVTQKMLEQSGYNILRAHDGQDAVDVVKSYDGEIHLAVLDMSMPVLGGPEAFPLLKEARPDMSIIICSGFELDAAAQSLLDAGAENFIQKPYRIGVLTQAVQDALKNRDAD